MLKRNYHTYRDHHNHHHHEPTKAEKGFYSLIATFVIYVAGAALAIGLAAAALPIVSAAYAIKKTYNSLSNLIHGQKPLRSLWRLAGMGGAGYGGWVSGVMLGSVVPGIGTVIGGLVGGIVGIAIGVGVDALLAKYTGKLMSYIVYKDTNPDKVKLSAKQKHDYEINKGNVVYAENTLKAIREEKRKIKSSSYSELLPFSSGRDEKKAFNVIIQKVKNAEIIISDNKVITGGDHKEQEYLRSKMTI
jgi:hypothetical protein